MKFSKIAASTAFALSLLAASSAIAANVGPVTVGGNNNAAASSNNSGGATGTGPAGAAEPKDTGGNGANGTTGDNPNPTGPATAEICYRSLANGNMTKIVCPDDPNASSKDAGGASQVQSGNTTTTSK